MSKKSTVGLILLIAGIIAIGVSVYLFLTAGASAVDSALDLFGGLFKNAPDAQASVQEMSSVGDVIGGGFYGYV